MEIIYNDKKIGELINRKLYLYRRYPLHYFRIFKGYGISVSAISKFRNEIDTIIFKIEKNHEIKKYKIDIKYIKSKSYIWHNRDKGSTDVQYIIALEDMEELT